uniref:CSON009902 protein n=1 Tax=Culicoides sonorensis TaxID=179676 RepID=A0A336M3R5_CULSO
MVKWLDQEFFELALRTGYGDPNIEVGQISLRTGTHDGDNYISSVYRSILSYRNRKTNVVRPHLEMIVKLIAAKMSTSLSDCVPFQTEVAMYQEIIPQIENLLHESVAPRLLYATKKPYHALVYEDAYQNGYRVVNIRHDLENTLFIADKLGKWHAATYHLGKRQPNNMQHFDRGLFSHKNAEGVKFIQNTLDIFINVAIYWSGFDKYVQKMNSFRSKFEQNMKKLYEIERNDKFTVLNHGDLNYHNILLKYDETHNRLVDLLFIDFQLSVFGTAAIDLYCLLFLITTDEVRDFRSQILRHYHSSFVKALQSFGYSDNIPTFDDLNDEMEKFNFLEIVMAVCIMPFFYVGIVNKKEKDDKAARFDPDLRKKIFHLEEYKNFIEPVLAEHFNC